MIYLKLPKDILILFITFFSSLCLWKYKYPKLFWLMLLSFLYFTILTILLSINNIDLVLAGIRWIIPSFLIFLLYGITDYDLIRKITKILLYLICINIIFQIFEMFYMPPFRGLNILGLSGRLSGFFAYPSVCGIFGAYCTFCFKYYLDDGNLKKFAIILSVLSVFLSMSSTGVALLLIIFMLPVFLKSKIKPIIGGILLILFFIGFSNMDILTGRQEGDSLKSGTTRVEMLSDIVSSSEPISTRFGAATNVGLKLALDKGLIDNIFDTDSLSFSSDSIYTSILTNYGWLFFITFAFILLYILLFAKRTNDYSFLLLIIISICSGISTVIIEVFPMNIIIAVLISYYLKKYLVFSNRQNIQFPK